MVVIVHLCFVFSKAKRRLEKKPPKRSTICTTPRFLMKRKGKATLKGHKQKKAASGEQKGDKESQTAVQQQKAGKKTKGGKLKNGSKTHDDGGSEKHKKTKANSS